MGLQLAGDAMEMNEVLLGGRAVQEGEMRSPGISWTGEGRGAHKGSLTQCSQTLGRRSGLPPMEVCNLREAKGGDCQEGSGLMYRVKKKKKKEGSGQQNQALQREQHKLKLELC